MQAGGTVYEIPGVEGNNLKTPAPQPPAPLVMIADAHLSRGRGNLDAFFRMLAALGEGPGDVVFLGDIFDLWIAAPRYEKDFHRKFLIWCRRQKHRRRVGFVEGNHEFFVARAHGRSFTWSTQGPWWQNAAGHLFCHGDLVNRADRAYLAFRRATKNPVSRVVIRGIPLGPRLVEGVKRGLKGANPAFRKHLPVEALRAFAEMRFKEGATRIFMGHFHRSFHYEGFGGGALDTLPAWYPEGAVSVLGPDDNRLRQGPWKDLLPLASCV